MTLIKQIITDHFFAVYKFNSDLILNIQYQQHQLY
jgi:hypothetical protein